MNAHTLIFENSDLAVSPRTSCSTNLLPLAARHDNRPNPSTAGIIPLGQATPPFPLAEASTSASPSQSVASGSPQFPPQSGRSGRRGSVAPEDRCWCTQCPRAYGACLLYTSPSPRDGLLSRMP